MSAINTYKWGDQRVLTGLFKSSRQAYQAQEVLTDFGYPKEASSQIKLNTKSRKLTGISQKMPSQINDKAWGAISIATVFLLGTLLTGSYFYSTLNFSEIAILLVVWASLLALSAVVCTFIGILVALLFSSELSQESSAAYKNELANGRVLLRVAVKTPTDIRDITSEWKRIGGKVV